MIIIIFLCTKKIFVSVYNLKLSYIIRNRWWCSWQKFKHCSCLVFYCLVNLKKVFTLSRGNFEWESHEKAGGQIFPSLFLCYWLDLPHVWLFYITSFSMCNMQKIKIRNIYMQIYIFLIITAFFMIRYLRNFLMTLFNISIIHFTLNVI